MVFSLLGDRLIHIKEGIGARTRIGKVQSQHGAQCLHFKGVHRVQLASISTTCDLGGMGYFFAHAHSVCADENNA